MAADILMSSLGGFVQMGEVRRVDADTELFLLISVPSNGS